MQPHRGLGRLRTGVLRGGATPRQYTYSLVATARDPLNVPMQSARFDGAITRYLSQTT